MTFPFKKVKRKRLVWQSRFAWVFTFASIGVSAQADMLDVEKLPPWEVCAMCHGLDGNSAVQKFPNLAGLSSDYIRKQLQDFRSGKRSNDGGQMETMAAQLEEEDIETVAQYFASQALRAPASPSSYELYQEGNKIYRTPIFEDNSCLTCHEVSGQGPSLGGQQQAYLQKQLADFKDKSRNNSPGQIMAKVTQSLSVSEMEALAYFLSHKQENEGQNTATQSYK